MKFSAKFSHEHKNIGRFSNLHWCTFNANVLFLQNSKMRRITCRNNKYPISQGSIVQESPYVEKSSPATKFFSKCFIQSYSSQRNIYFHFKHNAAFFQLFNNLEIYLEVENIYLNFYYFAYQALCQKVTFFILFSLFIHSFFYKIIGLSVFLKYKEIENINYLMK